jgi:hypothetical protein
MNEESLLARLSAGPPSPDDLFAFCAARGWALAAKDGRPALTAPGKPALAAALARVLAREPYRSAARARLGLEAEASAGPAPRVREFLWNAVDDPARVYHACEEAPLEHLFPFPDNVPSRAYCWRYVGEEHWRPIPGREGPPALTENPPAAPEVPALDQAALFGAGRMAT